MDKHSTWELLSRAAECSERVQVLQWVLQWVLSYSWIPPVGVKCQWVSMDANGQLVSVRAPPLEHDAKRRGSRAVSLSMQRCAAQGTQH